MRDFNSYKKSSNTSNKKPEGKSGANKNSANKLGIDGNAMNMLNKFATSFEGKSENEVISAIMLEAEKGRKNGTLSDADVDNFASLISPMLNPSQREKLKQIVKQIKNV